MKIFGERLKELRTEIGLSCKKLGSKIGVSDAAIVMWEHNQTDILGENLMALAKFFGVSADYLLGLEN